MKEKIPKNRKTIIKILACFFVVFPWITYLNFIEYSDAEKYVFGSQSGVLVDFFLYAKEIVLLLAVIGMLIYYFAERFLVVKKDKNIPLIKGDNKWLFVLSEVFLVSVIVATIFSEQKKTAIWGSTTEGEGLWTFVSYIVLILMFYNYFANEYGFQLMEKAILVVSCIAVVLAGIEFFYKPLLEIDLVRMLVAPTAYSEFMSGVEATVFSSAISLTFYNPGYFGGFVCLLLPFIVVRCIKSEKIQNKILLGILCVGLIFCVIATNATSALYLAILEVILVLWLVIMKEKDRKKFVVTGVSLVGILMITAVISGVITGNNIGGLIKNANSSTGEVVEERFEIKDIRLKDNSVSLIGEEYTLQIFNSEEGLSFAAQDGTQLQVQQTGGKYDIVDQGYENIDVYIAYSDSLEGEPYAKIFVDAHYENTIDFLILRDGTITGVGPLDSIVMDINGNDVPEELKKYYGIFTGRGYAWINSIPILKETILIGKGPGNFMFHFNQSDYVGLLLTHKNMKSIIDKPHSAYLQYAINIGIPGMLAFFAIIIVSLWKAIKMWKKTQTLDTVDARLHIGGMVSCAGFFVYSLVNDSIITVTPVLCMLLGILLATTYVKKTK